MKKVEDAVITGGGEKTTEMSSSEQRFSRVTTTLSGDNSFFGEFRERRVTFCVDTSGTMYDCLDTVKDELIATLERRATAARDGDLFNVIEFSTTVVQWADEMVSWTPTTVTAAAHWIRSLRPKTGTNTRDAIVAALADANCDAVYLVTDSLPDQPVDEVLGAVLRAAGKRPIHCRYIRRRIADPAVVAFLRDLAMETFGSLLTVNVSALGEIVDVTPVYRAEMSAERIVRTTGGDVFPSAYKLCSVGTSLDGPPSVAPACLPTDVAPVVPPPWPYCLYPWPYCYYYTILDGSGWTAMRWQPGKAWMKHTREFSDQIIASPVPGAGAMIVEQQVLARCYQDGLFYMGSVKSQVNQSISQSIDLICIAAPYKI